MAFPSDQLLELRTLAPNAGEAQERGVVYLFLPALALPHGCMPAAVDALLCPVQHGGYQTRLYLSDQVSASGLTTLRWSRAHILDREWHVLSWQVPGGAQLRLVQMVAAHLRAFQ